VSFQVSAEAETTFHGADSARSVPLDARAEGGGGFGGGSGGQCGHRDGSAHYGRGVFGNGLEIVRGEEERAGESFEAVGLGVVVTGRSGDDHARVAGLHERGEGLHETVGGGLPVEVGGGERHGF